MKIRLIFFLPICICVLTGSAEAQQPPASAFASLPQLSMVRLSPDGQKVAWANDPDAKPVVDIFDLATGGF